MVSVLGVPSSSSVFSRGSVFCPRCDLSHDLARVTRKVVAACVTCCRFNPVLAQHMGDLPSPRVRSAPPFSHVGVDYAGPFLLRRCRGRSGQVDEKVWVSVFVCMATKAIHLELAEGCSSTEFLDVFSHFVAWRGIPSHIYSDNGANFVGADAFFQELMRSSRVRDFLTANFVHWHFNSPAAPHFGGLWEAAVKSTKRHLFRSVPNRVFSRAELTSLLIQVEGCLNSRPLMSLPSGPDGVEALTPAHFLIGCPVTALPIEDVPGTTSLRSQ